MGMLPKVDLRSNVTGILRILGLNYSEISGKQKMKNIFEHLKEDITLICGGKFNQINVNFWKTCRNNLKRLASSFQVVIHFHPQPKTLLSSFSASVVCLSFSKLESETSSLSSNQVLHVRFASGLGGRSFDPDVLKVTDGLRNRYGSFSLFINELQIREDQNRFPCFEIPHIKFRLIALASLK